MADQKVKIDLDSMDSFSKKLKEDIVKGFKQGSESLDTSVLQKQFDSVFSLKGLKNNLTESFKEGVSGSDKLKNKQEQMQKTLKKNADLSASFTNAISSGAGKGEILQKGLKLAGNNVAGMLKNMNPYVAALKVAVKLTQEFLKGYQDTLAASTKFISQNSLFTDKATMSMMQRTGQNASGAQGTNRALDRLGVSFEDLQSGLVTKEQVAMFEQIRREETERLTAIASIGGPVFESMQHAAVAVSKAKQQVQDTITMAFAKSKGVMVFANSLQAMASQIGDLIWEASALIAPIVNIVGGVLGTVMGVAAIIINIVKGIMVAVAPIFDAINEVVNVVMQAVGSVLGIVGRLVSAIITPLSKIFNVLFKKILDPIMFFMEYISVGIDAVVTVIEPLLSAFESISAIITGLIPMGSMFDKLRPVLTVVLGLISKLAEGIAWVVDKIIKAVGWVYMKIIGFVESAINVIPKAIHSMISGIVNIINKLPGVNIKMGEYKEIKITDKINEIKDATSFGTINNETNYIYGGNTNNQNNNQSNANANLFANNYTIVNG